LHLLSETFSANIASGIIPHLPIRKTHSAFD
jgi:hypothetical protein